MDDAQAHGNRGSRKNRDAQADGSHGREGGGSFSRPLCKQALKIPPAPLPPHTSTYRMAAVPVRIS